MKIKIAVTIALILSVFLAGNIIFFGLIKASIFPYIYFIFASFFLLSLVYSIRGHFNKSELRFLFAGAIILTIFIVLFAHGVKAYLDKSQDFNKDNLDIFSQIDSLSKTNEYYYTYINYLTKEISLSQQNSVDLQAQINQLLSDQTSQTNIPTPQTPAPIPTPSPTPREDREEEEDD